MLHLEGDAAARDVSGRIATPVADAATLIAIPADRRPAGMLAIKLDDYSEWIFHASSTAADASGNLVQTPTAGSGRWLRRDKVVALTLPFTFATADAAVLFTTPVGCKLKVREAWWDVAVDLAGGASSAIGVHASPTGWTTKGDILGGAGGDVAAGLVASNTRMQGTIGAKVTTYTLGRLILVAADTLLFDRITSVFTSGSGNVRVLCDVVQNLGA